jgi:hypothetical protein
VIDSARDLIALLEGIINGKGADGLQEWFKKAADAYAEKQLARDELASKDQAAREGLALYLRIAAQHFRAQLSDQPDADLLERLCAAIDATVRAESHLDANVSIPLIFQQLAVALENLFAPQRA